MTAPVPGPPQADRSTAPVPGPPLASQVPAAVEQALARLAELDGAPVADHVEVFDGVHRLLQDALATLDEA